MLKVLRKKRQSVMINGLLIVIIGVFIFWGIGGVVADRGEVVAKVNGEAIPQQELDRVAENLARSYREMSPNAQLPAEMLRSQALDQLITARLFRQEAQKLGLQATDEELRDSIARIQYFQVDGRFDREQYLRTLQANRRSAAEFEDSQRDQVLATKLQDLIAAGVQISEESLLEKYRHDNERINLRYVKIAAATLAPSITLSDADLDTYYQAHRETFREPERARIEYLLFDPLTLTAQVKPTDEEIQSRYDATVDDYKQPEEIHARHILFKIPQNATAAQKDEARGQAAEVLKQLEAGADFATLAQQRSQDSTANAGGDLGWFPRGRMVTPFDQAAFALAPGAMSGVVETSFGFHIIKVEEKHPERTDSLEEAKPKVIASLQNEQARNLALQAAETAHDRLLDRVPLSKVAEDAHLTVQTPSPFAANERIENLGGDASLLKLVFETPTGDIGEIGNVGKGYVVFRVAERIESAIPEMTAVRSKVETAARTERAQAQAKEHAEALLKRLQESKDLDALAAAENLKIDESGPIGRAGAYVPGLGNVGGLKADGFKLTADAPIAPSVYISDGDAVIAVLKERTPADESAFASQEKTLSEQARRKLEGTLLQQFVNHLKANARIEIDPSYGGVGG